MTVREEAFTGYICALLWQLSPFNLELMLEALFPCQVLRPFLEAKLAVAEN
jgi:hypothetical protein